MLVNMYNMYFTGGPAGMCVSASARAAQEGYGQAGSGGFGGRSLP